jgi:hypothetical protein
VGNLELGKPAPHRRDVSDIVAWQSQKQQKPALRRLLLLS